MLGNDNYAKKIKNLQLDLDFSEKEAIIYNAINYLPVSEAEKNNQRNNFFRMVRKEGW